MKSKIIFFAVISFILMINIGSASAQKTTIAYFLEEGYLPFKLESTLVFLGLSIVLFLILALYLIRFLRRSFFNINKQLFREHEWLQTTLSSIDDAVITTNKEGIIKFANLTAYKFFSSNENNIIGKGLNEVVKLYSIDTHDPVDIPIENIIKGEKIEFSNKRMLLSSKGGKKSYVSISVLPIKNSVGKVKGAVTVFQDITAQVDAEILLKKERDFSSSIINEANIILLVSKMDGTVIQMNRYAEEITGFSTSEVYGKKWVEFLVPDDLKDYMKEAFERIKNGELSKNHENKILCKNGKKLDILWNNSLLYSLDGIPEMIVSTGIDITERKAAEEKLQESYRELEATHEELAAAEEELKRQYYQLQTSQEALYLSEERYRLAFEGANDGLWDWNIATDEMYFSKRLKEILGFGESELKNKSSAWLDLIHPDDFDRVMKHTEEYLKGRIPNYKIEYRIKSKSGEYKWLLTRGQAIWDAHGKPVRMAGSHTDITERRINEEKIQYMAFYDSLTGLPNRTLFSDRLNVALNQSKRYDQKGALLFLDLDNFKTINDTLGHAAGDILLKYIGEMIKSCIRESDTISRLSGDEFVILQQMINGIEDAKLLAKRILDQLQQPIVLNGCEFFITASIGITLFPEDGEDQNTLLKNADTAMYHAKELGKNNYQVFNQALNTIYQERLEMENFLRHAIERDELKLYYQPLVDIRTGMIVSAEALLRWCHPKHGMISPAKFIPIAEESGLIIKIGEWVLKTACKQNKAWQDAGYRPIRVSVNLSAKQFYQADFVNTIIKVLDDTGLDPRCLELEITESIAVQDLDSIIDSLNVLKEMGIRISLDDFGTGYSSLKYLKRLPIDILKIDKAFIDGIGRDNYQEIITQAVISIAHVMNVSVVAEGVETKEQLEFLKNNSCDIVQGYLFSEPIPGNELEDLLRAR